MLLYSLQCHHACALDVMFNVDDMLSCCLMYRDVPYVLFLWWCHNVAGIRSDPDEQLMVTPYVLVVVIAIDVDGMLLSCRLMCCG